MDTTQTKSKIEQLKRQFYTAKGQRDNLHKQKDKWSGEIEATKSQQEKTMLMKQLLETATEEAREGGKKVLAETSTNAVQMVMDGGLEVDMKISMKRGVPNADLVIRKETEGLILETDPAEQEGGGLADIVSVAMFISMGMLVGDQNKAPYFMDEPTKYVSKGNSDSVAKFLKEIVEYSGKQTILVTHDEVVAEAGDKVFKVEMDETGTSNVTEID